MTLAPLAGHQLVRDRLAAAVRSNRLPQVLLVTGQAGVGKQRLALWLGQLLLCERPGVEPCGTCRSCIQVLGLTHADLHWFVPVPTPKGDHDKQVEEVAELLEGVMAERRKNPLWTKPDGMTSHGVASARLMQRQASLTSVEGGWRVFIIGQAERLVPQESSPAAANSLLKLLEEPPQRSLFVLTTAEPGLVLPTIRSRAVPVRLGRVTDADVRGFLAEVRPDLATDAAVSRANGSIGVAIGGADSATQAASAADAFLDTLGRSPTEAVERLLRQGSFHARGEFTSLLDALAASLATQAERALTGTGRVSPANAGALLTGVSRVLEKREMAQGNINPQLLLTVLADELNELAAA
jgi:DNA polymerase-3 subunit delta'